MSNAWNVLRRVAPSSELFSGTPCWYYVRVTDRAGTVFTDPARSYEVAEVLRGSASLHGDTATVLYSQWEDGRWSELRPVEHYSALEESEES
jgi:hypothetical protein